MIREVRQEDAAAIAAINNHYVMHSDASFDTEPTDGETMRQRIAAIAAACPYFVCEEEGEVVGYCFAHPWKARPAYGLTLETTVYLAPGHRPRPDAATDRGVPPTRHPRPALLHHGRQPSQHGAARGARIPGRLALQGGRPEIRPLARCRRL